MLLVFCQQTLKKRVYMFWYQLIISMQLSKNENFSRHGLHDFIEITTNKLVEVNGFEPMTSCVQGRRSPN